MTRVHRSLSISALLLAGSLALAATGCGGSSSNSASSASSTTAAPATTTTIPTPADVTATCQGAASALQSIGQLVQQDAATIDYTTLDNLIASTVGPVTTCRAAMQAAVPGLPAAAQSAATAYAQALGGVVSVLQNGPADAAAVPAWVSKMAAAAAPLSSAQGALVQADSAFDL